VRTGWASYFGHNRRLPLQQLRLQPPPQRDWVAAGRDWDHPGWDWARYSGHPMLHSVAKVLDFITKFYRRS